MEYNDGNGNTARAQALAAGDLMPRPTAELKRGRYQRCGRCKQTGFARYNHRNGDDTCYLCGGRGWQIVFSAAEKAQIEIEQAWFAKAHHDGYQLQLAVSKAARKASWEQQGYTYHRIDNPEEPDAEQTDRWIARSRKLASFWVGAGLDSIQEA
jgi:hypothetical protein